MKIMLYLLQILLFLVKEELQLATKTGYLKEEFRLFHLSDQRQWTCPYHYHDFDKITLFLQGQVHYDMAGVSYALQPYDIVVIPSGCIHRPVITSDAVYERIIAYLTPAFLQAYAAKGCSLTPIFSQPGGTVLRQSLDTGSLYGTSCRLRQAWTYEGGPGKLLQEAIFSEFLIHLALAVQEKKIGSASDGRQNKKIQLVLSYIDSHLTQKLTIPIIARDCFLSPDYLMHLFKSETGLSLGHYITAKRLQKARRLIAEGRALTAVCYDCGFTNYSTFYRAWKKQYDLSPKRGSELADLDFSE